MKSKDRTASVIKVAAVATAMPRWVAALLTAEGFEIPAAWLVWWIPASALLSAGMAIVEGLAFSYVFDRWRSTSGQRAKVLFSLAILSGLVFVVVLAPYIAAQVHGITMAEVLGNGILWWVWSSAVALSTITIVASVGLAQKSETEVIVIEPPASVEKQHNDTIDSVVEFYRLNPGATQTAAGKHVSLSRQRVGQILAGLVAEGKIERNGKGVVVKDSENARVP